MSHHHHHHSTHNQKTRILWIALILTTSFLIIELIGGLISGSLALISDAAHMLTDSTALFIALIATYLGKRQSDERRTFGYYRFEVLAAAFNTSLLFLVTIYILYEAYQRLFLPSEIHSLTMLGIAVLGFFANLASMLLLSKDKESSLSLKSAYLEVWSDMIGSLGVILAALLIRFTQWMWLDSLVALLIGLWILPRTWALFKETINILLEGVPTHLKIEKIKTELNSIEGLKAFHDLHVWAITPDKIILTAHLLVEKQDKGEEIRSKVQQVLRKKFGISHTTLQIETKKNQEKTLSCSFDERILE